jgi:predicted alpha/beta superfamily hydrolase
MRSGGATMDRWILVFVSVGLLAMGLAVSDSGPTAARVDPGGDPSDSVVQLYSSILDEKRTLRISLPVDYRDAQRRYPVLYHLDSRPDRFPDVARAVNGLSLQGKVPNMIVVGIDNTDRWRDMLPVRLDRHPTAGGAVHFLFGQSNSALFAVFALTTDPTLFSAYIASSPSLGHCEEYILHRTASISDDDLLPRTFLFISNGGRDGAVRWVAPIPGFVDSLEERGLRGLEFQYRFYETEGHAPHPSLEDGLDWFFHHSGSCGLLGFGPHIAPDG